LEILDGRPKDVLFSREFRESLNSFQELEVLLRHVAK
jgi:hypothetical protein